MGRVEKVDASVGEQHGTKSFSFSTATHSKYPETSIPAPHLNILAAPLSPQLMGSHLPVDPRPGNRLRNIWNCAIIEEGYCVQFHEGSVGTCVGCISTCVSYVSTTVDKERVLSLVVSSSFLSPATTCLS